MLCFNLEAIIAVLLSYCKRSVVCMLQFESLLENKRKIKESLKTDADSSGGTIGIFVIAFKGVKAL